MFEFIFRRRLPEPLGQRGERIVVAYLEHQGYRVLAQNLRTHFGEVDVLALAPDGRTVVIVEVKASSGGDIPPEWRVGRRKQHKLTALAAQLLRQHHLTDHPVRFDVIGVDLSDERRPNIHHHVGAFEATV